MPSGTRLCLQTSNRSVVLAPALPEWGTHLLQKEGKQRQVLCYFKSTGCGLRQGWTDLLKARDPDLVRLVSVRENSVGAHFPLQKPTRRGQTPVPPVPDNGSRT